MGDYSIDRNQYEPPPGEVIEALAEFSVAVMEQADEDNLLFDMITKWSPERSVAYQKVLIMFETASRLHDAVLENNTVDIDDIDI